MTSSLLRSLSAATAIGAALATAGCASAPKPPVVAPAPVAPAPPAVITMAPIPNPEGPAKPHAEHSGSGARASKHAPQHAAVSPPPANQPAQADPLRAAHLRAAGLEQLNRGSIDRAVALLRQSSQLDPTNKLIQRDLDRALRIGQAVHAKR
jgi:hypothetical protein